MSRVSGSSLRALKVEPDGTLSLPLDAATESTQRLRYGGGKTAYAGLVNTAGDNAIITPAAGMKVRVFWVAFVPNSDNGAATLVTVKFGATPIYMGYALAHWEVFTGATDQQLIVNLTSAQAVAVTVHYTEVA